MSFLSECRIHANQHFVAPSTKALRREFQKEEIHQQYTQPYHTWNVAPNGSHVGHDKRLSFLQGIFGQDIEQLPAVVEQSRTASVDDGIRLPLFRLSRFMVTVKGFGSDRARKLKKFDRAPTIIMGVCLWNANWLLTSKQGFSYKLVLQSEREALKSVDTCQFAYLRLPTTIGFYHRQIVFFQREMLSGLRQLWPDCQIRYHLPLTEYSRFIEDLPFSRTVRDYALKRLHDHAEDVRQVVLAEVGRVSFVDPIKDDLNGVEKIQELAKVPLEIASFVHPYWQAHEACVGVEDIVEYSLPSRAERIAANSSQIVCLFGLLGFPHPYLFPQPDESFEDIVL